MILPRWYHDMDGQKKWMKEKCSASPLYYLPFINNCEFSNSKRYRQNMGCVFQLVWWLKYEQLQEKAGSANDHRNGKFPNEIVE